MEKINFFGILKDSDLNICNFDKTDFKKLIEKKIVVFEYEITGKELEEEKKFNLANPNETFSLDSFWFHCDYKCYRFNDEIFNQMLSRDSELIESFSDAEKEIIKIDLEIEKEIDLQRKIETIEFYYEKYFRLIKNNHDGLLISNYLLYKNGTKSFGVANWFELYKENITGSGNTTSVVDFLNGKSYFYNKEIIEDWKLIYEVSLVCDFCKKRKQQLANPNFDFSIEDSNKSKSLFKDDGHKIFQHIVSNHSNKLNPAFFSYLFSFLGKNNKLVDPNQKNSNAYIDLVFKNYGVKMSKIIYSESTSRMKDTMHNLFNQYLENYSNNE